MFKETISKAYAQPYSGSSDQDFATACIFTYLCVVSLSAPHAKLPMNLISSDGQTYAARARALKAPMAQEPILDVLHTHVLLVRFPSLEFAVFFFYIACQPKDELIYS